ncbi:MAG TPA: DUF5715 family protein [Longimicrobiales bacterium]|nr:DUF5715 family protein [Longimicrobiales bacterium]
MTRFPHFAAIAVAGALCACVDAEPGTRAGDGDVGGSGEESPGAASVATPPELAALLTEAEARIETLADSLDDVLHPVPLLTAAEERGFLRFRGADHVALARELGVDPAQHREPGAGLVELPASSRYWIVRELDHSEPQLTPSALALLEEIGTRFQERLRSMGLPPYRFEVTSALRTPEDQIRLRADNPNAAAGRSAHEYGTTVDIAYVAFAAPLQPVLAFEAPGAPWLEDHLRRYAAARLETVAARRSRELQAILGQEVLDLQEEGRLLATLEVRQPVYHLTVAR